MHLVKHLTAARLNECIVSMQPGFLQHYAGEALQPTVRDRVRATMLREIISEGKMSESTTRGKGEDLV